jgi:hypothetical protein
VGIELAQQMEHFTGTQSVRSGQAQGT